MELYDSNKDGYVAGEELDAAPALKASLVTLDSDGDGKVSVEELTARIQAWKDSRIGIMSVRCAVVMKGRPLVGAIVTYDPEPYLADYIATATGTTDEFGYASMSIPKESRPTPDAPPGVRFGLYRVRISINESGNESIPAKYNTNTILGQEISFEDPRVISQIVYSLKSS